MEKYIYLIASMAILAFFSACSDDNNASEEQEEAVTIDGFELSLDGVEAAGVTRAIGDYVVNTGDDPSATLSGRETWLLDVSVYKSGADFPEGNGTFVNPGSGVIWTSQTSIYFPNYLTQRVSLLLYPAGWNTIAVDQSNVNDFFEQDILEQNGNNTINLRPAHIPTAEMRHAHSMLDFRITDVDESEISSVTVTIGGIEYEPYQVLSGDELEYLLIIPVGTTNIVVNLFTVGGARYQQIVTGVTSTVANNCYCFTLEGLELQLGIITIVEWTTGPGILGQYTREESYPTFRGPVGLSAVLYYDNGLSQPILFNERGESTMRPAGRTLIAISSDRFGRIVIDPPLILRDMVIDLSVYFESFYRED